MGTPAIVWPLLLEDVASGASRGSPPLFAVGGGGGVELGLSDPLVSLPSDDEEEDGAVEGRLVTGVLLEFLS